LETIEFLTFNTRRPIKICEDIQLSGNEYALFGVFVANPVFVLFIIMNQWYKFNDSIATQASDFGPTTENPLM